MTKSGDSNQRGPAKKASSRRPAPTVKRSALPRSKKPPSDADDDGVPELKIPLKWKSFPDGLVLQEPFCAMERREDLEEVDTMIAGEEYEIARDELLYLVADCRAFFAAHNLLGELALLDENIGVARGHFGFVIETVSRGLPPRYTGRIPARRGYNRHIFQAGKQLARCLVALDDLKAAGDVLKQLVAWDSSEREVRALLEEWRELTNRTPEGRPLVQLSLAPRPHGPAS